MQGKSGTSVPLFYCTDSKTEEFFSWSGLVFQLGFCEGYGFSVELKIRSSSSNVQGR